MYSNPNKLNLEYLHNAIHEIEDYAILLMDIDGKIMDWNNGAQKIKQYKSSEIIGKNFRLFYTEKDIKSGKPDKLIQTAIQTGRAQDEGWRIRKDQSLFWGSITISAIHDKNQHVIGFCKVTRDLTERRKSDLEREKNIKLLISKNKELEQFAFIASHDLQEPLRSLISFAQLIEDEYKGKIDADMDTYINFIIKSSKRMQELIKGLLDYSRIGKEKQLGTINCNLILQQVIEDMTLAITESDTRITVAQLPTVKGYELEIRQLFQNLISNAIKFRNKQNKENQITVTATEEEDNWHFTVKDNGIGIEEKNQSKIFEIFKRLNNRSDFEGSGIGLSHCKKIVDLHEGKIWVESSINEGSAFHFTIDKQI